MSPEAWERRARAGSPRPPSASPPSGRAEPPASSSLDLFWNKLEFSWTDWRWDRAVNKADVFNVTTLLPLLVNSNTDIPGNTQHRMWLRTATRWRAVRSTPRQDTLHTARQRPGSLASRESHGFRSQWGWGRPTSGAWTGPGPPVLSGRRAAPMGRPRRAGQSHVSC